MAERKRISEFAAAWRDRLRCSLRSVLHPGYNADGTEPITRITLDYHRRTGSPPEDGPQAVWDDVEQLTIDRKTGVLALIQNIGPGCRISRRYEMPGGVGSLLDNFSRANFFPPPAGGPDDVTGTPEETRDYQITIEYPHSPRRILRGSFDQRGLPEDFGAFAGTIRDFLQFYGMGEILDPSVYGRVKRRRSDLIFCSVLFDEGYKRYYYLTDDDTIAAGDYVLVPAGRYNRLTVVQVERVEYFQEKDAPLPIEMTKKILRKCTDRDLGKL